MFKKTTKLSISAIMVALGLFYSCQKNGNIDKNIDEKVNESEIKENINGRFINGYTKENFHKTSRHDHRYWIEGTDDCTYEPMAIGCFEDMNVCSSPTKVMCSDSRIMAVAYNDNFWKDICRDDLVDGVEKGTHTLEIIDNNDGRKHYIFKNKDSGNGMAYHFIFI